MLRVAFVVMEANRGIINEIEIGLIDGGKLGHSRSHSFFRRGQEILFIYFSLWNCQH